MKPALFLAPFLAACALSACASNLERVRGEAPEQGSAFSRALAAEYRDLAAFEADLMSDWADADYFARKSLRAAAGEIFPPADPVGRDLPRETLLEIFHARDRLLAALETGARERAPDLAARAQARFDCWLEQQEEDLQPEHISACRDALLDSLAGLER